MLSPDSEKHVFFLSEINQTGQVSHTAGGGGAGQGAGIIDEKQVAKRIR